MFHQKRRWKGGFKTKTAALAYAANPEPDREKCPTLRSYYNGWEAADYQDLSKSKQTAFRIAWGKLNAIADREMDSITINDLQTVVDEKAQTYYPAKDMKTLLSHLFKRAVAEGHAHRIPGHGGAGGAGSDCQEQEQPWICCRDEQG